MANPVLNKNTVQARASNWAPPLTPPAVAPGTEPRYVQPRASSDVMTIGGTIGKTLGLFGLLLVFAVIGWQQTVAQTIDGTTQVSLPGLAIVSVLVGFGLVMLLYFKPRLARYIAPLYAIAEGFFVGAISKYYEAYQGGVVVQAVGATAAVFFVMLLLYATRTVRVTDRFRSTVISATIGLMVFYGISIVLSLFGTNIPFLSQPSLLGIGFSIFAAGLASLNLLLDFDIIERGVAQRFDKDFEWYAAFGLLVTIVWLYLEMLRLLSKFRSR